MSPAWSEVRNRDRAETDTGSYSTLPLRKSEMSGGGEGRAKSKKCQNGHSVGFVISGDWVQTPGVSLDSISSLQSFVFPL